MAGYLFSLDSHESLRNCVSTGVYATKIPSVTNNIWRSHHEGTFADYCSMRAGDNIYFFIDRKIYGIGHLVNVGTDCKYLNYPTANIPNNPSYEIIRPDLLVDFGVGSADQRFICFFEPAPLFFMNGIDMDDVLSSDPDQFKILRVFWKLSFIKFGDEENQAFKDIVLQRNSTTLTNPDGKVYVSSHTEVHAQVASKVSQERHNLDVGPFLSTSAEGERIKHEMAIEAAIIFQLSTGDTNTCSVFGHWDYLSHQVVASPFKPVDYMDKMDLFGYAYIPDHRPTISKFLVVELKKDLVTAPDLLQLMKYVDWVKDEYAMGDYSMIDAFIVGSRFDDDCFRCLTTNDVERNFIYGVRPTVPKVWRNVKLVSYVYEPEHHKLSFETLADGKAR